MVSLFFGPQDFVIQCHPTASQLQALDDGETETFTYGALIRILHKHPESHLHYCTIKAKYAEKVKRRLFVLETMTAEKRYEDLKSQQPWVLSLADEADIESYLGISTEILKKLRGK